jgi:hypothetical protein
MLLHMIVSLWRDRVRKASLALMAIGVMPALGGGWLFPGAAAAVATPGQEATCDKPANFGADATFRVTEQKGRALIEIAKPNTAGRKLEVEYGDELYVQKFTANGSVRLSFALTAPSNEFTLTMSETAPVKCSILVPEFARIYRAILRWHDPVQLDLSVLEPGGRPNESGDVSGSRPNTALDQGIGQMDVIGGVPAEDATGEMSYVADAAAIPPDGVFGFKVDFVTRGAQAEAPYCDANALAAPRIDFIKIENGRVTVTKQMLSRAHCHDKIPDRLRLMLIRQ